MPKFSYTARKDSNTALEGVIDGGSLEEAASQLKKLGYFLLSVEEDGGGVNSGSVAFRAIKGRDLALFTSRLSILLRAGLPLISALRTLTEQVENQNLQKVISEVRSDVEQRGNMSSALAMHPRCFDSVYCAAVRAGEESGMLADVLARLAEHLKTRERIRQEIRSALAYPVFLCFVGTVLITALLAFVIPRFTVMFVTMNEQLPLPTKILLAFSGMMSQYWYVLLLAFVLALGLLLVLWQNQSFRHGVDGAALHFPLVGKLIHQTELGRFCRTLGELLAGGLPILAAIDVSRGVVRNRILSEAITGFREAVGKGKSVSESLAAETAFGPLMVNMVAVAEISGELPKMLTEVADIYESDSKDTIQTLTDLLGPALIVVLGGIIGFVVIAILLPVFESSTFAG